MGVSKESRSVHNEGHTTLCYSPDGQYVQLVFIYISNDM